MSLNVLTDQLLLIRVEGMHCHKCEMTLQRALGNFSGVREVEIDFNSKLASILVDRNGPSAVELVQAVVNAGYDVAGFSYAGADERGAKNL